MKSFSHTRLLPLLALSGLTVLGALPASAQIARSIYLYNSSSGEGVPQEANVASWGNGLSERTRRKSYEGAPSLQVTTRSFTEGVRFDFKQPVDPTPYINNGFIRMRIKFTELGGGGGAGGGFGGMGIPGGGGAPGGFPFNRGQGELVPRWEGAAQIRGPLPDFGGGGGFPGFGMPGGMGGEGGGMPTGPLPQSTYIKELKVTLMRDKGVMTGRIPVNLSSRDNRPDDNGWRLYTLALKDMTSTPNSSGSVRRVILTSDAEDTFYLAQMALVVETGQMTASIRTPDKPAGTPMAEVEWRPDRPLTLVADVEAGAADPQVEWNFDADNVGNLPAPAINGGVGGLNPDGSPAMGGDPRMGGMMGGPGVPRDPRGQLGIGGGGMRPGAIMGNPAGGIGEGGQPAFVGPRIDARGLSATYSFPNEEQNYRVEVTVRDRSGQKQPVKASILVRIRG